MSRKVVKTVGAINAQAYVNVKLLAKIDYALYSMGREVDGSMSALIVSALEFLSEILDRNGKGETIGELRECLDYLEERGYSMAQLRDKKRNRGVVRAFLEESVNEFNINLDAPRTGRNGVGVGKATAISKADIERSARKTLEELNKRREEALPVQRYTNEEINEYSKVSMSDESEPIVKGIPDRSMFDIAGE